MYNMKRSGLNLKKSKIKQTVNGILSHKVLFNES